MQSEESAAIVTESPRAIPLLSAILVLSFVTGGLLLAEFRYTPDWGGLLLLLGLVTAFGLDWVAALYGIYAKWASFTLFILIMGQASLATVVILALGYPSEYASSTFLVALFVIGIAAAVEHGFVRARTFLRVRRGLRDSGSMHKATATAVLPPEAVSSFKPEIIEQRVLQEIKSTIQSSADTYTRKKADTDFGFNVAAIENYRILYRVQDRFIEAVYIYEDGVIGRFEKVEDEAARLRLVLSQVFHFGRPLPEEEGGIRRDIEKAYRSFAAPTFSKSWRSLHETWRIRRRAVFAAIAAVAVVAVGFVAAIEYASILSMLSQPSTNNLLGSAFYATAIGGVVLGAFKYLYGKGRGKSAK
jgi:hypothetical protein